MGENQRLKVHFSLFLYRLWFSKRSKAYFIGVKNNSLTTHQISVRYVALIEVLCCYKLYILIDDE